MLRWWNLTKMYIISACLAGFNCKYNGKNNYHEVFGRLVKENKAVPFCPEQAGGLPTPRPPSEIKGGDGKDVIQGGAGVVTVDGKNVTENFIIGAKETLKLVELVGAREAILKSNSPSCGCRKIYDGTFRGVLKDGMGVTAAYLKAHGIRVIDSEIFLKYVNKK